MLAVMYDLARMASAHSEGAQFTINSDHLNHTWFQNKRAQVLTRRQAKWSVVDAESYYAQVDIQYKEKVVVTWQTPCPDALTSEGCDSAVRIGHF